MTDPLTETLGRQSFQNFILPNELVDDAVRRWALSNCSRSIRETSTYRNWLVEATKRYEAMRSVRSLDHDDPITPWRWASNVGIPVESIAGESLVPRFNAATVDSDPIFRVDITMDDKEIKQAEDKLTRWYQDVLTRRIRLRAVRNETYKNLAIDGDGIEGAEWHNLWTQRAKTVSLFRFDNGEFLTDEAGEPVVLPANSPPKSWPEDESGRRVSRVLVQQKLPNEKVYEGPKVRSWRLQECMWPEDSNTPDIQELDWFGVQMHKSISWFKTREGDPIEGKLKNVKDLIERHRTGHIPTDLDTDSERFLTRGVLFPKTNKILVWLVFGKFDVDSDGVDEEIIAMVAPKQRVLLGWRLSPFIKRPFFHFQLFKMPGRFTGRGLSHVLKGMRDMIDFLANSSNNRINMYQDPPLLYEMASGYDPDIHEFGTGAQWGPLAEGGLNKVKLLEIPQIQETVVQKLIDFYMGMVQRLTAITDLNLGGPKGTSIPNIKTAAGTQAVLSEGQIHFSDLIQAFQETSEELMEFIDQELMPMADDETLALMSPVGGVVAPFIKLPKRFHATGNSSTMSRQSVREMAVFVFQTFLQDPIFNLDPKLQLWLRRQLLSAFDQNVELPQPEEVQQLQQQQLQQAILQMPPEGKAQILAEVQKAAEGGQNGQSAPAT